MKKNGFTLIELIVAASIFSIVVGSISTLFVMGLRAHRTAIAQQNLVDNTRFALEHMARQIRTAQRDESGTCSGVTADDVTYQAAAGSLTFLDYHSPARCVRYELSGGKILMYPNRLVSISDFREITSDDIRVNNLEFLVRGGTRSDGEQPAVTISIDAEALDARMQLQTTVSARNFDTPL